MQFPWHLYIMAALYILAGINHFARPKMYMRIMPAYIPAHRTMVNLSGVAEILLGLGLCFPETKDYAVYGIIIMLVVFLPIHFHMLSSPKAGMGLPRWLLVWRIPLQFVLIWWAWTYLKI
ncbi:DoxX family protein [Sinomicrobium sp. M5D2P17]